MDTYVYEVISGQSRTRSECAVGGCPRPATVTLAGLKVCQPCADVIAKQGRAKCGRMT